MSDYIEPCSNCKKQSGYAWHYSTDSAMTNGWGECKACGFKYGRTN